METAERWYGRIFVWVTALLILAAIVGYPLSPTAALVTLVTGVILLGLPHGALDPLVARKTFAGRRSHTILLFYAAYLILVLAYWLLWSRFPTLGLFFFLLIAAFHFGSDWESRGSFITRCSYGLAIVTLPAVRFPAEVASIYAMLGSPHGAVLVASSRILAPVAVGLATIGAALQFRQRRSDSLELLTIVAGATLLSPLVFFTCYFALLHSPQHLLETAEGLGMTSLKSIYRETSPVVIATLVLAALAYYFLPHIGMDARLLRMVFIGLAALTVPHMLLETVAHAQLKRRTDLLSLSN